ncbi:MAG: acyl-CoA/acyl-ACP dehydrogenase [Pseudomonadales bacterium]|nr:acyl-CoA/acyl-ACP dehydrogenase [Pseudomonadales bacterium]
MDFNFTEEQLSIQREVTKICEGFDADYWFDRDHSGEFPFEFSKAMAAGGWLGIAMPEEYGGSGLGITEAAIMMQAIAESGAAFSGASSIHLNIFGLTPVVKHGTAEQKERMLPPLIKGEDIACFGVTEPDAGLNTAAISTRAVLKGDQYIVNGGKVWTSTAQVANKILLILRTTPAEQCEKSIDGLSLFYTDLNRKYVEVREIEKMGRKCVDSNQVFFDNMPIPVEDRIGEEGKGFRYLLDGLNPERVLIAAESVGVGRAALAVATEYAKERVVFGRPIGQNQGIQHPLAESWCELEAANLMAFKAGSMYDRGENSGPYANGAKYLSAEAAFTACTRAMNTLGGYGYAKEYHVERYMREIMIPKIAPISPQLVLSFIAERVLGLPKSY